MGSLEAMTKGSDSRYLGDKSKLKIAQGVSGAVADKGSILKILPYTMHAVKQGFQDLGVKSIHEAHSSLANGNIRLEVHIRVCVCSLELSFVFVYIDSLIYLMYRFVRVLLRLKEEFII
mgnify:FL=1